MSAKEGDNVLRSFGVVEYKQIRYNQQPNDFLQESNHTILKDSAELGEDTRAGLIATPAFRVIVRYSCNFMHLSSGIEDVVLKEKKREEKKR